ncbi:MAG: NADPH-dependent F420 reductase [Myxococcales bacterium]|nr:NADPH-dependent F420 reductase [Myxococcales bacterium]
MRIGIVGGTGKEARGLALRWARAGHSVAIGSRDAERARERAQELSATGHGALEGGDNLWAVTGADVVVLTVPYGAHGETLRAITDAVLGKVIIDLTVPLRPPKVSTVQLPPGQAAALEAQAILGAGTPVVAALHHVSGVHLADPDHTIACDVLIATDDARAREVATSLIRDLGLRPLDAGPLQNAIALESLTPILIHLNKRYKSPGAGVVFTGIPDADST